VRNFIVEQKQPIVSGKQSIVFVLK